MQKHGKIQRKSVTKHKISGPNHFNRIIRIFRSTANIRAEKKNVCLIYTPHEQTKFSLMNKENPNDLGK